MSHEAWNAVGRRAPLSQRKLVALAASFVWKWLFLLDVTLAGASMVLSHALSPVAVVRPFSPEALGAAVVFAVSFSIAAYAGGLYDGRIGIRGMALLARLSVAALVAAATTLAFFYVAYYQPLGRRVIIGAVLLASPLMLLPRLALHRLLRLRRTRVLFVGHSELTVRLVRAIERQRVPLYEVVASWPPPGRSPGSAEEVVALCRESEVDEIVIPARTSDLWPVLVSALHCLPLGCHIRSDVDFHESLLSAVPVGHVAPDWVLSRGFDTSSAAGEALKRASDVAIACFLLVLLSPFFVLGIAAVWLGRDGPVFFSQVRVGRYGRPFRIFKLRSMKMDAEASGPQWAQPGDDRRTRAGEWLRRARLDELPQLVNILLGDMSIVGPRPERPEFVATLEQEIPYYGWRHVVRPGLTGWAQINHPYGANVQDARRKLEYDLFYIRHHSLVNDLSIVLRTIEASLRGGR